MEHKQGRWDVQQMRQMCPKRGSCRKDVIPPGQESGIASATGARSALQREILVGKASERQQSA